MKVKELEFVNAAPLHIRRSYIIGCGGMGAEAANHFKRTLTQRFDTRHFNAIQVLCFDSAQPDHTAVGDYLKSHERERVYSSNLSGVLENLQAYPRIKAWFSQAALDKAREIVSDLKGSAQGAASTRPLGRIGFFENWSNVYNWLRHMVQMQTGGSRTYDGQEVPVEESDGQHFYIVASVGGGTGTGIFFDVAALIRKLQRDLGESDWTINAVLVSPEMLVRDRRISREYAPQIMANGYAALKELDHIMHGNPLRIQYGDSPDTSVAIGGADGCLFDSVYLVDAENAHGKECASRDQMASLIGEMLFHLTATEAGRDLERRIPDVAARLFFQRELPEETLRDGRQKIVRERRRCLYSTFGHTTLQIPVRQILDYCARQRSLEVFEYLLQDSGDQAPEEIQDRVRTLMDGSPTEQPVLEQLGITTGRLDRALDVTRYLPALPPVETILEADSPAEQLQGVFVRETWSVDRAREWANRVKQVAGELKRVVIEGETRQSEETGKPETIPSRIEALVNELTAREGAVVVDQLLDRMEEELVTIQSESEAVLQRISTELEVDAEGGSDNKHWRSLRTISQDIAEIESRRAPGPLRRWFNRRRVGPIIEDALVVLQKLRRRYLTIPTLMEKIALCRDLIDEINRQDDLVLPARVEGLRAIREELRSRRDQSLMVCQSDDSPILRKVAPRLHEFYRTVYLPRLGTTGHPAHVADELRSNGIELASGRNIKMEYWGEEPQAVVDALQRICAAPTWLNDDDPLPTAMERGAKGLWSFDYDSPFFQDTGSGADDFDFLVRELMAYVEPYLGYSPHGAPNQPWYRLIAGSCRGTRGRDWNRWVKTDGLDDAIYPGLPNQATLLSIRMAFPLFKLERIREWKRHYDECLQKGWPLHLFAGAEEWNEPYIPEVDQMDYDEDVLFQEGLTRGVIQSNGDSQFIYRHPRNEVQALFHDENGTENGLSPTEFTATLKRNRVLAREILEDIVEDILDDEGMDPESLMVKLQAGEYPQFIRKELEAYLLEE